MAENNGKGSLNEYFRNAWRVFLAVGCGLFWLGRNILTPAEVDGRVSAIIRPLEAKSEWIEAELRRHEQSEHSTTVAEWRALERRIRILEDRVND